MESYQDIRLLPDPEFGTELLMAALLPNCIVRWGNMLLVR